LSYVSLNQAEALPTNSGYATFLPRGNHIDRHPLAVGSRMQFWCTLDGLIDLRRAETPIPDARVPRRDFGEARSSSLGFRPAHGTAERSTTMSNHNPCLRAGGCSGWVLLVEGACPRPSRAEPLTKENAG